MRLQDEVALITGSTRGIGRVMARTFAEEGAKVVVTGRTKEAGQEVVGEIESAGGTAIFVPTDITVEAEVKNAMDAAVDAFGKLTIMVNNAIPSELVAGPNAVDGPVVALTTEHWDDIIKPTITAPWWACKYAVPLIAEAGGGSIVNISSLASMLALGGSTAYSVAKAGMHALTRSVAFEAGRQGVRCNTVVVGFVPMPDRTDELGAVRQELVVQMGEAMKSLVCTPDLGTPECIAECAVFFASRKASFVTGTVIVADGGSSIKMGVPDLTQELFAAVAE